MGYGSAKHTCAPNRWTAGAMGYYRYVLSQVLLYIERTHGRVQYEIWRWAGVWGKASMHNSSTTDIPIHTTRGILVRTRTEHHS